MNALDQHLEDYLELRHHLGFKLYDTACELRNFVRFAQEEKAYYITTKLAIRWATQPTGCQPARWGARLAANFHKGVERNGGGSVRRLDSIEPYENTPHRHSKDRL
jgi:hypothetical protein